MNAHETGVGVQFGLLESTKARQINPSQERTFKQAANFMDMLTTRLAIC